MKRLALKRPLLIALGVLGSILATYLMFGSPARHAEAVRMVAEIAAMGTRDPAAKPRKIAAVTRAPLSYEVHGRPYRGDIYRSGKTPLAGIILIPGAAAAGTDDPRLVEFAAMLASARFLVLVPELPGLRERKVRSGDIRAVTDAFTYLLSLPELTVHGRAGIGAFSVAAGPAILAALDPDIRDRVQFMLVIGGYYDLPHVLTYMTTGYYPRGNEQRYREPNQFAKWVFVLGAADLLQSAADRRIITAMVRRKEAEREARLDDLAERLGPEGRALYDFITNTDPTRASELIAQLPLRIHKEIAALNLAGRDLSGLRARFILVHGLGDGVIPYTESIALSEALRPGQAQVFIVRGFGHVETGAGVLDAVHMWRAVNALLAEREGRKASR